MPTDGVGREPGVAQRGAVKGGLTIVVVGLGAALGPLDSAVNIAFPSITDHFEIPLAAIQWVIICYVLTYAGLLLNCGRLADVVGHRRVFVSGVLLSALALAVCGSATSFGWLLFFRALQGIGTALVLAAGPALVTLSFPDSSRARALGGYTMILTGATALGPLLGGVLVEQWGWGVVFWFRVPLAVLVALALWFCVPQPVVVDAGQRFDLAGALTLTLGLVLALLAFNRLSSLGWTAPGAWLLAMLAALALAAFVRVERRVAAPVIALALFRNRAFVIANLAHILSQLSAFIVLLLGPYFLVAYTGGRLGTAGVLLALSPIGGAVASALGGLLLGRFESARICRWALAASAAGLAGVSLWAPDSSLPFIAATLLVQGAGQGLFQVANMDYVMGSVPRSQQGVAGALTMLMRTIGVVIGATAGAVLFAGLGGTYARAGDPLGEQFMQAYTQVFWGAAAIALAGLVLMWLTPRATPAASGGSV